jgi:hypothetical protein
MHPTFTENHMSKFKELCIEPKCSSAFLRNRYPIPHTSYLIHLSYHRSKKQSKKNLKNKNKNKNHKLPAQTKQRQ